MFYQSPPPLIKSSPKAGIVFPLPSSRIPPLPRRRGGARNAGGSSYQALFVVQQAARVRAVGLGFSAAARCSEASLLCVECGAVAALASDPMNAEPVCPQGMWLCGAPCAWLCACVAVCGCLVCSPCDVPVCVCACAVAAVIESLADRGFAFDVPQVAAAVAAPT